MLDFIDDNAWLTVDRLREIVPQQKISPVQFSIENEKITIIKLPASPDAEDVENVEHSRGVLLAGGQRLITELQRSNCDKRLLESLTELQKSLEGRENIIRLGLKNIGCETMCAAFDNEMPEALKGMFLGHTRGISMYVAQFSEWQKFSEKAASINLNDEDIAQISRTAQSIVAKLEENPQLSDPDVPRTIRALQALINDPRRASKRAAFAVLRTIENLVAKIFEYSSIYFEKTANKTIDGLSSATSRVVIIAMTLALVGATGLSPVGQKVADAAWLKTAAEIVQAQIENWKQ